MHRYDRHSDVIYTFNNLYFKAHVREQTPEFIKGELCNVTGFTRDHQIHIKLRLLSFSTLTRDMICIPDLALIPVVKPDELFRVHSLSTV